MACASVRIPAIQTASIFGRRSLALSHEALQASLVAQIAALRAICHDEGATLSYVKAHGMLYNDAARDLELADCLLHAVAEVDASLHIMALAGSAFARHAAHMGWHVIEEGFVDRAYTDAGHLVPRDQPGALLSDDAAALQQALALACGQVRTQSGSTWRCGWIACACMVITPTHSILPGLYTHNCAKQPCKSNNLRFVMGIVRRVPGP